MGYIHPDTLVLVVDAEGKTLGKMLYVRAKKLSEEQSLDLVEVSKNESLTVYKIMDQGKWSYEKKKNRKQKPSQKHITKSVKFSLLIDPHDKTTKVKQIIKFLSKGYSVNMMVFLKGREKVHPEFGRQHLQEIIDELGETTRCSPIAQGSEKNKITFSTSANMAKGKKNGKTKDSKNHERREAEVQETTAVTG